MLIMDVDGVLTDGSIYLGDWPGPAVAFNSLDGAGLKFLQRSGIRAAILTGRQSEGITQRASMLGIEDVVQNAKSKMAPYEALRDRAGLTDAEIAYMGDDLPDLPVMRRAGLSITVPNAPAEVREAADMVTQNTGGRGAVREAVEFVLKAQGKWEAILARYLD
jgi:3-deoxy-D-manno-octulosonate 8-phosphate phosphatase (KDO 8-P phosphatase)